METKEDYKSTEYKLIETEVKLINTQRKLIANMIISIILLIIISAFGYKNYKFNKVNNELANKYVMVVNERDSIDKVLDIETTHRIDAYQHPFNVMVNIGEAYPLLTRDDQLSVDSLLTPVILSFKRAGLCK